MNPQTKLFKTGVHLFHENDRSRELYVIQSGNVKVYRTQSGREVELAVMGKGSVLGEMALIDGRPRSASAKALDECTVSIIDADVFHNRIKGVPPWFMTIIKMTCQKIRNANRLLQSMGGGRHGFNIILAIHYQFARDGGTLDYSKTKRILARFSVSRSRASPALLNFWSGMDSSNAAKTRSFWPINGEWPITAIS